ncbi:MAG: bifunctional proline dehydrogenase/L-glutamate gamma-semialdehyde dehydrogenase PutA [Rhodobacteraceae bacterium]|nr:bifunctional proline dehydrogenase/L-glutamate gamma-semialdehyde dehydrogenase PutA [Paracoccaceae bacterium]
MPDIRKTVRQNIRADEAITLHTLIKTSALSKDVRAHIVSRATTLVEDIRQAPRQGLMEVFLNEYGLSTDEGIALMTLAEALLRVPDSVTIDALIDDKITPSDWGRHLGHSSSSLVNASTWALLLTGKVLDDSQTGMAGHLRALLKRVGEPVIRTAVARAMREMGRQFVLGRDIGEAMARAAPNEAKGYGYSYDMLGEAAMTKADAKAYFDSYLSAIKAISANSHARHPADNPGISVKLSALFPRYEFAQKARVMADLVPRLRSLAEAAALANIGFNIDAEEAARLEISLDVIEAVLQSNSLKGWDGFGVVVQAYAPRALPVIDWLNTLATRLDRRIMVRLVKGAYWDSEIKLAQVEGLDGFPVFTRKASTDVSYIACARKLLAMAPRIYPQFATHNAHSVAAILEMAPPEVAYEFQRLHGMGEALHEVVKAQNTTRCRVYAPVGAHRDLLAYLVRRLLENGANSSFVNQITDRAISASKVAACPFGAVETYLHSPANPATVFPAEIFAPERKNAAGMDLDAPDVITKIEAARQKFETRQWQAEPLLATPAKPAARLEIRNPARAEHLVGHVCMASPADIQAALIGARPWQEAAYARAEILHKAADLFESNADELMALATFEAGKTLPDALGELREAVDFLRYYAAQSAGLNSPARGIFTCISPWNFPLAIFTGQIGAALAAGNGVLAKPAEATPLIAYRAVELLHEAGVPRSALQLLPGAGDVGAALTSDRRINGVCFTGSTPTAKHIQTVMAEQLAVDTPLIAETGGINAMIVDSSALPEQAVRDILASAFQSAGQRCSALRVLYLQEDVADIIEPMLFGAMDELEIGDPSRLSTDIGPVIDAAAHTKITTYIAKAESEGRLLKTLPAPKGRFVPPTALRVAGMAEVTEEIFGPVLHIAHFKAADMDAVVDAINASGFGLTFGLHTRIDARVQRVVARVRAGNIYINRNQIGAVVGSQPFGGEGLSGTGPKAGGPHYLGQFTVAESKVSSGPLALPGPTGESNRLTCHPRGTVLCLGPEPAQQKAQAKEAIKHGCTPLLKTGITPNDLIKLQGFDAVSYWGDSPRPYAQALAKRQGAIAPLILKPGQQMAYLVERHICIDTTASGGNTGLLAANPPD